MGWLQQRRRASYGHWLPGETWGQERPKISSEVWLRKENAQKDPFLFDSQPNDWSLLYQERPDHLAGASTQVFCWASFSIGSDLVLLDCLPVDLVLTLADFAWFGEGLMLLRRLALNLAWLDSALRMQQLKTWPWLLFYWKSVFCPQLDIWSSQSRCGLHLGGILFPVPQPLIIAVQMMQQTKCYVLE